jgi:hypothetical protein
MLQMYTELLERFSLLIAIRTLPVGVASLMSGRMPVVSPLGLPPVLQVDSGGQFLGLFLLLTVIGWMVGGLYFYRVALISACRRCRHTRQPALSQTICTP